MAKNDSKEPKEGSTAHDFEPGKLDTPGVTGDGPMPMGMVGTGGEGDGDPDQKSSHVPPKTVESTLPDGSPTYRDPGTAKRKQPAKAGRFEAVGRFTALVNGKAKTVEPGEIVELEADEADSLGENVKPAK